MFFFSFHSIHFFPFYFRVWEHCGNYFFHLCGKCSKRNTGLDTRTRAFLFYCPSNQNCAPKTHTRYQSRWGEGEKTLTVSIFTISWFHLNRMMHLEWKNEQNKWWIKIYHRCCYEILWFEINALMIDSCPKPVSPRQWSHVVNGQYHFVASNFLGSRIYSTLINWCFISRTMQS